MWRVMLLRILSRKKRGSQEVVTDEHNLALFLQEGMLREARLESECTARNLGRWMCRHYCGEVQPRPCMEKDSCEHYQRWKSEGVFVWTHRQ